MTGKKKVSRNAEIHGLYSTALKGKDAENLKKVQEFENGAILQSNFEMIHAKLYSAISGEVRLSNAYAKIYAIAEMMVESGEFSENDLLELKLRLANVNLDTIARVSVTASSLASAAVAHDVQGNIGGQNQILREFVVEVLKNSTDVTTRGLAIQCISRLKLDAGLPVEELEALIHLVQEEVVVTEEDITEVEPETSTEMPS